MSTTGSLHMAVTGGHSIDAVPEGVVPSYARSMTTTAARPRTRTPGRIVVALVVVAALAGIVVAVLPSVALLLDPPDPWICPMIWPPATSCVPGAHLVVAGVAVVLLT